MLLDLSDVSQRFLILNEHLWELQALFWTDPHDVPQQEDPVWSVANLHTDGHALEDGAQIWNLSDCLWTSVKYTARKHI